MSTTNSEMPAWQVPDFEPLLTPRERRRGVALPEDPDDEELVRHWTLTREDRVQVLQCRGDDSRRWFAIQVCVLRRYGRFLSDEENVPPRLVAYLSHQLALAPEVVAVAPHPNTQSEHERRIRDYLGFTHFDEAVEQKLSDWLGERARQETRGLALYAMAESQLKEWRIVLPTPSRLERTVARIASRVREEGFALVEACLTPALKDALDRLLETEGTRSALYLASEYPGRPTVGELNLRLDSYQHLEALDLDSIDWSPIPAGRIQQLAELARRYNASSLRRLDSVRRHALAACLALESRRTLLDHLATLHDGYLAEAKRRARRDVQEQARKALRQRRKGLLALVVLTDFYFASRSAGNIFALDPPTLVEEDLHLGRAACLAWLNLEDHGWIQYIGKRYSAMRKYLPRFFNLPFAAGAGGEHLLEAVRIVRDLDRDGKRPLPSDVPLDFVSPAWLSRVLPDGRVNRPMWELALAFAVRDALRSGDLYLPQSRRHASFSTLIYEDKQWAEERGPTYQALALPQQPDDVRRRLRQEFEQVARETEQGLATNPAVSIRDGRLHLKRGDSLPISPEALHLKRLIRAAMPDVRIETILQEVDRRCHFSDALVPLPGSTQRRQASYGALMAALVAQGTNLGLLAMGKSAPGLTTDMLQYAMDNHVREETLVRANAILVDYHHAMPLSRVWGDGSRSSSDGQRFAVQRGSMLATSYPLYFGYYDRAISVYTHISDHMSVFSTQVIACGPREAPWVLEGLQRNHSVLKPGVHFTDTGGYTDQVFALCYLLGLSFRPRLADLPDHQLYKPDPDADYGQLNPLFRYNPDTELIMQQWDELVRVAAAIRNNTTPAHVIVNQLQNARDRRARALTALGQIIKTVHILRYVHDAELRSWTQLQLNRGESRQELARHLFFAQLGEFVRGDYPEIMNKATALSLLSNAILVWNTAHIDPIVARLRASGTPVADEDLARTSPLLHRHISINGTYSFQPDKGGPHGAQPALVVSGV